MTQAKALVATWTSTRARQKWAAKPYRCSSATMVKISMGGFYSAIRILVVKREDKA